MTACRVCGSAEAKVAFDVREMMFGTRETFRYHECGGCGSQQILEIPPDLARHYPSNYLCWTPPVNERIRSLWHSLRVRFGWRVVDHQLGRYSGIARVMYRLALERQRLPAWMGQADLWRGTLSRKSAILDVGCGSGGNLALLSHLGFSNLHGIDPLVDPIAWSSSRRFETRKADLSDLTDAKACSPRDRSPPPARFRLIMFHHSLEHVPDPVHTLATAETLLEPNGWILVRVPVASSVASREYGPDWVQLDAPRHVCLFTTASMSLLAERVGLSVEKIVFDSTAFQFWGSEQYRRDIPLEDIRSVFHAPPNGPFTPAEMHEWEKRAIYLNEIKQGDQAIFYLRRSMF